MPQQAPGLDDSNATPSPADDASAAAALGADLLTKCVAVQQEVALLGARLREHDAPFTMDKWLRHLIKESRFVQRLRDEARTIATTLREGSGDDSEAVDRIKKIRLQLSASNIPGYTAQWALVKRCSGLAGFHCTAQMAPPPSQPEKDDANRGRGGHYPKRDKRHANDVFIDAIVDDGAEWLRIMGVTQTRLVHEMTAAGWDFGEETVDDSDDGDDSSSGEEDIPVVQAARDLVLAARANRHDYIFPRVHIVLPRITEGLNGDIDVLIARMRRMGDRHGINLTVDTAESPFVTSPTTPRGDLETSLNHLLPQTYRGLTPAVNLDCSVLIALASDITHTNVTADPARHKTQNAEIEKENADPGRFLRVVYPALQGRELVCTREAARTFAKLTGVMATPTELERGALLLPNGEQVETESGGNRPELLARYKEMSVHTVPDDLRLPVRVVGGDWGVDAVGQCVQKGTLPRVADAVMRELTEPSRSVFAYGWASGLTTVTSNRVASNAIKRLVERNRTDDDERGPKVWVCTIARSLKCTPKDKATSADIA